MATKYPIEEQLDTLEMYFETRRNAASAAELYQKDVQTNARYE